jgi:hypothetical protein
MVQAEVVPALAKYARTGHPVPDWEKVRTGRAGHPPMADWNGNTRMLVRPINAFENVIMLRK